MHRKPQYKLGVAFSYLERNNLVTYLRSGFIFSKYVFVRPYTDVTLFEGVFNVSL